ncbi:DUF87 domain-containing protein [Candidatus Thorarchaeota archaeon]|nr:MAG: DUF87 domain-containing protein [Candidatus Thorarchaeota archaeon]
MSFYTFLDKDEKEDKTSRAKNKAIMYLSRIWYISTATTFIYFTMVYLLPLYRIVTYPIIPFKIIIEYLICIIPILSGFLLNRIQMNHRNYRFLIDNDTLFVVINNRVTGISCLEITSTSGSINIDDSGIPKYNASMLLAIRAGLDKSVNMIYEGGAFEGQPFLRFFINIQGKSPGLIKETLRREATRIEAILLASLNMIDLRVLEDSELMSVIGSSIGCSISELDELEYIDTEDVILMTLRGVPRVHPLPEASQVGTFISTIMKQGYSTSMSCIFSAAKPGRERRRLEGKWRTIQSKEKRKEESLKDHALKKQLIVQYEEIQDDLGWFDSSVYFIIKTNSSFTKDSIKEGVSGIVQSIWGGQESIKLEFKKISKNHLLKLLIRKHFKKQRIHVSRLVAFVNTPVKKLPIIGPEPLPIFPVPSHELLGDDLLIGDTIFEGRPFSTAGLKIEWLREHVAILGATGTGKTTLVKNIIVQLSNKTDIPWWIFDVKGSEYEKMINQIQNEVLILKPGLDKSFKISLMDSEIDSSDGSAYSTFIMLRELLKERGDSSELSPAMERLLRESVLELGKSLDKGNSIHTLIEIINELSAEDRIGQMTRDALLNRLQIIFQDPLCHILSGGSDTIKISSLLSKRVIFDLSYVARAGGMDSARILYNLIAKRIFEYAMRRGVVPGLEHVVVLEEANNLVPESYSKNSSADVSTGESMVLLQRATGQGVIVVSTRPNISSNILANTATKIIFRLPYDSEIGGKFLSLDSIQETYLRSIKRGRALVTIPDAETFEVVTRPFIDKVVKDHISRGHVAFEETIDSQEKTDLQPDDQFIEDASSAEESQTEITPRVSKAESQTVVFNRVGKFGSHVVAYLASAGMATELQIRNILCSLDSTVTEDDISEVIRDLVSLGTIDREALSLVQGGFVFTLPDNGLETIRKVIIEYITEKLEIVPDETTSDNRQPEWPDIIVEDKAVIVLPQNLKASSMESTVAKIRHYMGILGNDITELFVIVRGSVAAAKLRELLDRSEEFDAVSVVSAFPSSLDSMIESLNHSRFSSKKNLLQEQPHEDTNKTDSDISLIGAIHDIGPATSRAIQIRLWFGLIQDFVDLSNGLLRWEVLLDFIETTALQSLKGRSAPLTIDEGRRALTELLADEVLIALRANEENKIIGLEQGLWIVNSSILKELREKATIMLEAELKKHNSKVSRNHGYYDICAGNTSYVIFPNQQQLSTLLNLHSDVACRTCKSNRVVCILTASEYLEDSVVTPGNLVVRTMEDNSSVLVT